MADKETETAMEDMNTKDVDLDTSLRLQEKVEPFRNTVVIKDAQLVLVKIEDTRPEDLYYIGDVCDTDSDSKFQGRYMLRERRERSNRLSNVKAKVLISSDDDEHTGSGMEYQNELEMSTDTADDEDFADVVDTHKPRPKRKTPSVDSCVKRRRTARPKRQVKPTAAIVEKVSQAPEVRIPLPRKIERTCIECGEMFYNLKKLGEHAQKAHGTAKPFKCFLCQMDFAEITEFNIHKIEDHDVQHTSERSKAELSKRRIRIAWTPADILCHYCGKKWDTPLALKQHKAIHLQGGSSVCELCHYSCKKPITLRHHFQVVHLGFKHTGSQKKMQQKLKESQDLPENERKAPFVTCDICGKLFWWEWKLSEHKYKYHGVAEEVPGATGKPGKPYSCDACGLYFKQRNTLLMHLNSKKHRPDKALICETCGMGYRKPDGLRKHITKRHPEVTIPRRYEYGPGILDPVHNHSIFDGLLLNEESVEEEMIQVPAKDETPDQPLTDPLKISIPATEPPLVVAPSEPSLVLVEGTDSTFGNNSTLEHESQKSQTEIDAEITPGATEVETSTLFRDELEMSTLFKDELETSTLFKDDTVFDEPFDEDYQSNNDISSDTSSLDVKVDQDRLERLRRACKRRWMTDKTSEENYRIVPSVSIKIEEDNEVDMKGSDHEWIPDDEVISIPVKRKNKKGSKKKRKRDTRMTCRLDGCRFRAVDRTALSAHRAEIHKRTEPIRAYDFKCELCSFRAKTAESLSMHGLTHTAMPKRRRVQKSTKPLKRLVNGEKRKRKGDTKLKCRLGGCKFRAVDRDELNIHRKDFHGREDGVRSFDFKCEFSGCNFRARFAESMESHRVMHQLGVTTNNVKIRRVKPEVISTSTTATESVTVRLYTYPCTYAGCSKGFHHRLRLLAHIEKIHKGIDPNAQARNDTPTVDHKTALASDFYTYTTTCRLYGCKFKTFRRSEMEAHRKKAHASTFIKSKKGWSRRNPAVKWIYCGINSCTHRAILPESMATHKRTVHDQLPSMPNFTCPHCDKVFASNNYRQIHVKLKHSDLPQDRVPVRVPCMYCSRTLSCRVALFGHIQRAHPEQPTHPCEICTKVHYYENELTTHEERHRKFSASEDTRFKCVVPGCTETHTTKEELTIHVQSVHDIPVDAKTICPTCGKECLTYGYPAHARTHIRVEPKFSCSHCPKKFRKRIEFETHEELCHPEVFEGKDKTFICDSCGMSFYSKSTFNMHRYRTHGKRAAKVPKRTKLRKKKAVDKVVEGQAGVKPRRKRRTKEEMMRDRAVAAKREEEKQRDEVEIITVRSKRHKPKVEVSSPSEFSSPQPPQAHRVQHQSQQFYPQNDSAHWQNIPYFLQSHSQIVYNQGDPHYLFQ